MELEQVVRNYQNRYLMSTPLYTDMGGGLNTRTSKPELKVNQSAVCENVIFNAASGALRSRAGMVKLIGTAVTVPALQEIFGFFQAPFSAGRKILVATAPSVSGSGGKIFTWTSPSWVDITGTASISTPVSKRINWAFYNNTAIGVDGTNPAFKVPSTLVAAPLGGTPPTCKFVVVWNDYVVMAGDGTNKVYYSDKANPESWPVDHYLTAGGNTDGDPITGLAVAYGHLIIFKRNSIFSVSGATETDFSMSQIGRSTGLVAEGALCNAENDVWFLGPSGMYVIGSDLTPQYMSDYVLPDYQGVISGLSTTNANLPAVAYNSSKQQVWVSVDSNSDLVHDKVYVHDLINKDASGRPAISVYKFYSSGATNLNPKFLANYLSDTNEPRVMSLNSNNYVYLHDADLSDGATGDDGNPVQWQWQSKFLNLGDPMRLKTLRYYTVMGDDYGGGSVATNRNYAYNVGTNSWAAKTGMTYSRRGVGVAALGGKVYCAGGYTGTTTVAYLESYDPNTDTWTTKAAMPAALAYGALVSDGTYLYHIGGYNTDAGTYSAAVYRYDPNTDTWATRASMPTARCWHGADIESGVIYCFGGYAGSGALGTVEAYTIASNTWASKTAMPTPRYLLTSTTVNGKIYCTGGFPFAYAGKNEEYDPALDSWATKSNLATPRYEHVAVAVSGKLYLIGGYYSGGLSDVDEYDPSLDTYTAKTDILSMRYWGGAAAVSGIVYLVGGNGLSATMSFVVSDDFNNSQTVSFDLNLNTRKEIPATAALQKRYWSVIFSGYILEGLVELTGWNLDYTMFQRRN